MKEIDKLKIVILRAWLMGKAQHYNEKAVPLSASGSVAQTCESIELSGMAKGLLEAVERIDDVLLMASVANDNKEIH